jgi:ABC-type uncharacterized transport system substrate-binding protein
MSSQPIIDEAVKGIFDGLNKAGYSVETNLKLNRFNAEGDLATLNAMASELTSGNYDLVITLTTTALQAVANANRQQKVPHVFGCVTDPVIAGVGIGKEPLDHPPYMVGIGTMPPASDSIRMAKRINPKLSSIGIPWNPAEVNSEVSTKMARETCRELKIDVVEASVENSAALNEAVASLVSRHVDLIWIGGDVTVLGAFDLVAKAAKNAHIPVCTCIPGNAPMGSLFDLGANYTAVGQEIGKLAGQVLSGEEIARIPNRVAIPPKLMLNKVALTGLRDQWTFPADILANANAIIDETGLHEKSASPNSDVDLPNASNVAKPNSGNSISVPSSPSTAPALNRVWQLRLIAYVNSPDVEEAELGLRNGLKGAGLVEHRDYELKTANAQGDMTSLHGMVDAALADGADLLLTISTQVLQSASHRARGIPIVFTMVANPFAAGIAKSESDHLPNVTGSYGSNDADTLIPIIKELVPGAKRIGSLFVPTEVNSVYANELVARAAKVAGLELVALGVNSSSEASDVTQSLCGQPIDLICLPNSNLAASSFPTIAQVAKRAKIPIFGFLGSIAPQGAVLVLTRDYVDMGYDSGQIAARVMRGEKPGEIPLHQCRKTRLLINRSAAKSAGILIPESLLKRADLVID